jgi:hypothetical protein
MRIFGLIAVILTFVCLTLAACGDDGSACGDCDDHNPCTFDVCEATGCVNNHNNLRFL